VSSWNTGRSLGGAGSAHLRLAMLVHEGVLWL
jgi:hypothetical protein